MSFHSTQSFAILQQSSQIIFFPHHALELNGIHNGIANYEGPIGYVTCWYLSQAEAFNNIFFLLRQLQRLKTMNIYIDDLTNYSSDGCLQSRYDAGAHS